MYLGTVGYEDVAIVEQMTGTYKTYALKDREHGIHKQGRRQTGPDKRHRQDIAEPGMQYIGGEMGHQGLMMTPGRFFETDLFTLDIIEEFVLLFLELFE